MASDFNAALDPARSAVVEACAGSGKTWLLASRIVRLLLSGVQPAEILAITFTRKAAREIEERVSDWLRELATASDEAAIHFLDERGAIESSGVPREEILARARSLYERVIGAQPGLSVNTFHGWFLQLVAVAPLSANLSGATLADDGSRRFEELWQTFARTLQRAPQGEVAQAFVRLLGDPGSGSTRKLLRQGMARRAEWLAHVEGEGAPVASVLEQLRTQFGVSDAEDPMAGFFAPGWDENVRACADVLVNGNKTESEVGQALLAALRMPAGETQHEALAAALLTRDGGVRQKLANVTDAMSKRLGSAEATAAVGRYNALAVSMVAAIVRRQEARNFAFNRDALTVYHAFLQHLEAFKAERRQIDFVDAEWRVLQLLQDESSAAFIQARLDARYHHVLLDEFQDTNPLQWRILLAWLDAYGGAADVAPPTVFLVGDPKQSIYRFRRAEPRLFATATDFLVARFSAARLMQDETRRNAPAIIDVVNSLFASEPAFQPFRPQRSLADDLPGRVELLPLFAHNPDDGEDEDEARAPKLDAPLRDPLSEPAVESVDNRRQAEAVALAARLAAMVGRTLIRERQARAEIERPLRYGDILLLVRKRTQIAIYERALAAAGIPFVGASRGGLLDSLEVSDVVALLEFLVTPAADLQLAHALKSPVFACDDDDLLALAARPEQGWHARLKVLSATGRSSPHLLRAARLIEDWIAAAATLPAHDLLDRIYHEGEVLARYRLAVPEARRAAALANLEALLLLALDLDGGRYPSLPRFIDELKALRKVEGDDAPDEGELASEDEALADGRVRILTIHGAKGLEAPLVWLLDANAAALAERPWEVLVDWPPTAAAPSHFSFVGKRETRGGARAPLIEAEARAVAREELNLLYVAVTRAKQLFFVSGSILARGDASVSAYGRIRAALARLGAASGCYGQTLPESVVVPADPAGESVPSAPLVSGIGERRASPDDAARFGILLHALIERQTENRDTDYWWRSAGYTDAEFERVRPVAARLLSASALQVFFDAARYLRAWNELEIATAHGAVCRLDRLVELEDVFWVLDYKSSGSDTERIDVYRDQVAAYCRIVAEVFPGKSVRGALIFADASLVEVFP